MSTDDTTEPDSKRHQGSSLVSTSDDDLRMSVEVAPRVPDSLSTNIGEPQAATSSASDMVDTADGIQPAQLLATTASRSVLSEEAALFANFSVIDFIKDIHFCSQP